jgi:hypothetical protein
VVRLPGSSATHNHVGGPHAWAPYVPPPGCPARRTAAELTAGIRPEFPVLVKIGTEDGSTTAEMTVLWTLRPH